MLDEELLLVEVVVVELSEGWVEELLDVEVVDGSEEELLDELVVVLVLVVVGWTGGQVQSSRHA